MRCVRAGSGLDPIGCAHEGSPVGSVRRTRTYPAGRLRSPGTSARVSPLIQLRSVVGWLVLRLGLVAGATVAAYLLLGLLDPPERATAAPPPGPVGITADLDLSGRPGVTVTVATDPQLPVGARATASAPLDVPARRESPVRVDTQVRGDTPVRVDLQVRVEVQARPPVAPTQTVGVSIAAGAVAGVVDAGVVDAGVVDAVVPVTGGRPTVARGAVTGAGRPVEPPPAAPAPLPQPQPPVPGQLPCPGGPGAACSAGTSGGALPAAMIATCWTAARAGRCDRAGPGKPAAGCDPSGGSRPG